MFYGLMKFFNGFINKIGRKILEGLLNIWTIRNTYRVINRIDTTFEIQCLEEDILIGRELDIETEFFDEFFIKLGRIWLIEI